MFVKCHRQRREMKEIPMARDRKRDGQKPGRTSKNIMPPLQHRLQRQKCSQTGRVKSNSRPRHIKMYTNHRTSIHPSIHVFISNMS